MSPLNSWPYTSSLCTVMLPLTHRYYVKKLCTDCIIIELPVSLIYYRFKFCRLACIWGSCFKNFLLLLFQYSDDLVKLSTYLQDLQVAIQNKTAMENILKQRIEELNAEEIKVCMKDIHHCRHHHYPWCLIPYGLNCPRDTFVHA